VYVSRAAVSTSIGALLAYRCSLILISLTLVDNLTTVVRPDAVIEGDQPGSRKVFCVTWPDGLRLERQLGVHVI